jgi:hypothetical protein
MSSASDLTSTAFIYKSVYSDRQVGDLAMRFHPTFKILSKEGKFTGADFKYAIRGANPQGVASTFDDAKSGASSSKGLQLTALRKRKYGYITMDGESIAAADGDKGAFMRLVTMETDGILEEMGDSLAFDLFRDGGGARGQRASISGDTVTLTVADDARNFKEGMTVIAGPNADGSSIDTGTTTVVAVDEDAGKITLDDETDLTAFADSDYLFRNGDQGGCMEGLAALFPLTAPVLTSDSFRGVDRGVDPRKYAGVRFDDTAVPIHKAAGKVAVKIGQVGQRARIVVLNPLPFFTVTEMLDAKVTYDGGGVKASAGFEGFDMHTSAGTIRAVADPDCPVDRGYVLNLETIYLKHLRALPHIVMDDGIRSLRQTDDDGIEARARSWCNAISTRPGSNGVFSIAA